MWSRLSLSFAGALCVLALAGCTTPTSASEPTLKPVDVGQAIQDGFGAPTDQITYAAIVAKWDMLTSVADEACTLGLTGDTGTYFVDVFAAAAAEYDSAQVTAASTDASGPAGYPAAVPQLTQTQSGSEDWCAVPTLLGAARS
jgi:hypothetical protein